MEELVAKIAALNLERGKIHETIAPLNARLLAIYEEIKPFEEARDALKIAALDPKNPDWGWMARSMGSYHPSSVVLHRFFDKLLLDTFHMYHSGMWTDTDEAICKVMVGPHNDDETERNILGVRTLLPILTPHENGRVWFGIFDHTLGMSGSFVLEALPDGTSFHVTNQRGYSTQLLAEFETAHEAVWYIRKHHWYGDEES